MIYFSRTKTNPEKLKLHKKQKKLQISYKN